MPLKTKITSLTGIRAIITTKWTKKGYRPLTVHSVENYYVDSALDNDADTWQLQVGDPDGVLMPMLERDNEVRVQIYGFRPEGVSYIITGVADELGFSEDGTWTITGRDLSSLATDSTVPPQYFKNVRAQTIVDKQAKELGFRKTQLTPMGVGKKMSKKTQYTDGSESYWEFWYRLYRKEKKWLWTEPDGTLVADQLNYQIKPSYYFGVPRRNDPHSMQIKYLPIEHAEWAKGMQQRWGNVWVFGHKGDNGFLAKVGDPHTHGWIKKPRKIMLDQDAHTIKSAQKMALEEFFEGQVGENELKITIPDPGFTIRQNRIAVVRIPDKNYENTMFVVGTRTQVTAEGFFVEVRLRERNFAVSRRVPADPRLANSSSNPTDKGATTLASILEIGGTHGNEWSDFFVKAANQWHGPWEFNLFLATVIAMCDQETGGSFTNIRENGGPGGDHIEWYPWKPYLDDRNDSPQRAPGSHDQHGRTRQQWEEIFANSPGSYGIHAREMGVGPMQLTSSGLKTDADKRNGGKVSEFAGNRWNPEDNIWIGVEYFRSCLKIVVSDSGRDIDIWKGCAAYNGGPSSQGVANGANYAQSVKSKVINTYLPIVKDARQQAVDAAKARRDNPATVPGQDSRNDKGSYRAIVSDTLNFAGPDQGIDFTGAGGIYAVGDATITRVENSGTGWPGEGAIVVYQLDIAVPCALGIAGRWVYNAEDLDPLVKVGDKVQKGAMIARATGSFKAPGIEIGWAQNAHGSAYGTIHDGKSGGPTPIYGNNFADFVKSVS